MQKEDRIYPFVAVVGQDEIKQALILNIINPKIGGVLISGEKGTAKSTLVRGLESLLQDKKIINLPLNVTEDRLMGSIDIEHAVLYGEKLFEPGLLYQADKNILYIDEVNLLGDHISKLLLESAASSVNHVEREGISYQHKSSFILIGSMNPEEGPLRAQLLDRFGLYVEAKGETESRKRAEIIRRRVAFEKDPEIYQESWREKTQELSAKILRAIDRLSKVEVTENAMQLAVNLAQQGNCEGHRGELVIIETAKAIAALDHRCM